ncbi:hypothetical protein UlMin_043606 [Ulmus minor]
MENSSGKRKSTISISLFTTLSESFTSSSNSAKSPRIFEGGVVGLGIVAAMTDLRNTHEAFASAKIGGGSDLAVSPRSRPIPIVSSAKPAANFRGGLNLERDDEEVDELSESYTCVISHCGNNSIKKRVYFGDKLNGVRNCDVIMANSSVFSASPANIGEVGLELWTSDFLSSCFLCNKQLHGIDIFMYRGEKAFCSSECRDKHIRSEDYKEKCSSEALKPMASPCSSPQVYFAGVAAA